MRWVFKLALGSAALGVVVIGALVVWPIGNSPAQISLEGDVGRGAYLARASGCIACHTDFEAGGAPLAGGVELKTPFGTLYSPNLTGDPVHGIGDWTIQEFAVAVRQGISPEGEAYYPAFTYPFYANFTDQDIADLWAAYQTVAPVAEPSKPHEMAFPFDQRWGLKLWRAAFLKPPRTKPNPDNDALWNRGRLLVGGATHCAACHTARNFAGARKTDTEHFKGNATLPGGGKAPAIDYETLQMRGWTVDNLSYALSTGVKPDGDAFGDSMGEVVLYGTSFLSPEDHRAMAIYLLDDHSGG
ncbi:c-type cytochrome [Falsihalocynthiibacter sp. S25ZX9]|uniref:c-type cytochrome n=1 Tax=Falsihalocynthiibacter sp. S25ZX9 TaxID=3240870 RepID=UPI003510CD5A